VRFSTVAGSKGSADLARDVRGFAVKLYTKEGNWDLVGNNIPVFFIRDAIKFPDIIHAAKEEPDRGFPQVQTAHDNFWDFISLNPESTHMALWIMSDRTIPRSFRFMEGFGVHTFRLVNAKGKSTFVKFHWKPKLGMQSVVWNEALKINGADPDFHRRDLWDAIQAGDFPEWELGLQLFDEAFADKFAFDVLDATKLIPEEEIPVRRVGRLVLDRVVDNFFAETEQVAFCTQNIVPGIDFTNDPAAGSQFLLSRYAAEAARRSKLYLSADQRSQMPVSYFPAGRAHGVRKPEGSRQLRTEFMGRVCWRPS
jgi:catalase